MGRTKDTGLDCIGFVLCVYKDLGVRLWDPGIAYPEDFWKTTRVNHLMDEVKKQFHVQTNRFPSVGDLLIFWNRVDRKSVLSGHLGILGEDNRFYHSLHESGVRESALEAGWARRLIATGHYG